VARDAPVEGAAGAAPEPWALLAERGGGAASRDETVRALQRLGVRLLIVDGRLLAAARALRLPVAYEGEGITVLEVPAPELAAASPSGQAGVHVAGEDREVPQPRVRRRVPPRRVDLEVAVRRREAGDARGSRPPEGCPRVHRSDV
jgi:hypothetical protein